MADPYNRQANGQFGKGNRGGGRKPRPVEEATIARFREAVSDKDLREITENLVAQAKDGSLPAIKLLFSYLYGYPRQSVDIDANVQSNVAYDLALEQVYGTE